LKTFPGRVLGLRKPDSTVLYRWWAGTGILGRVFDTRKKNPSPEKRIVGAAAVEQMLCIM
jgi:hypothetical protein